MNRASCNRYTQPESRQAAIGSTRPIAADSERLLSRRLNAIAHWLSRKRIEQGIE